MLAFKSTLYYIKCIKCVEAFREQSVKLANAELFNGYMQSLKRSVPDRGLQDFWDLLVQDALTLINKDEVEGSNISKQDANEFLVTEEKKEAAEAEPAGDDYADVDDLLDMM